MLTKDRQKKLVHAEKQFDQTMRRISRLQTAARNWNRRITYHKAQLEKETAANPVAQGLMLVQTSGRKFR